MKKTLCVMLALVLLNVLSPALAQDSDPAAAYESAQALLKENRFEEAAALYTSLGAYLDAPRYAVYARAAAAGESGLYSVAAGNLSSLSGLLDSELMARYYLALSLEAGEDYEGAAELLGSISLYRDAAERLGGYPARIKARDYSRADALEKAGNLDEALSRFKALNGYQDSAQRADALAAQIAARDQEAAERARAEAYDSADTAEQEGRFKEACDGFTALGQYRDSAARAASLEPKAKYASARALIGKGNYEDALAAFRALSDYQDSAEKVYALGLTEYAALRMLSASTASFRFHDQLGLIDFDSNNVTPPMWDSVDFRADNCYAVSKKNLYGLTDSMGRELTPCKWFAISEASEEGVMVAAERTRDEARSNAYSVYYSYQFTLLDTSGKTLAGPFSAVGENLPSSNSSISLKKPEFPDGLIRVQTKDDQWGYIDPSGAQVIECRFSDARSFSFGLAAVRTDSWGYIDPTGADVIAPRFAEAFDFDASGLSVVRSTKSWHIIDKAGAIVYFRGQDFDEKPNPAAAGFLREKLVAALTEMLMEEGLDEEEASFEVEDMIAYIELNYSSLEEAIEEMANTNERNYYILQMHGLIEP